MKKKLFFLKWQATLWIPFDKIENYHFCKKTKTREETNLKTPTTNFLNFSLKLTYFPKKNSKTALFKFHFFCFFFLQSFPANFISKFLKFGRCLDGRGLRIEKFAEPVPEEWQTRMTPKKWSICSRIPMVIKLQGLLNSM